MKKQKFSYIPIFIILIYDLKINCTLVLINMQTCATKSFMFFKSPIDFRKVTFSLLRTHLIA